MTELDIYSDPLIKYLQERLDLVRESDDGGGRAFAYQQMLDALYLMCDYTVDGKPSIVDENGGI